MDDDWLRSPIDDGSGGGRRTGPCGYGYDRLGCRPLIAVLCVLLSQQHFPHRPALGVRGGAGRSFVHRTLRARRGPTSLSREIWRSRRAPSRWPAAAEPHGSLRQVGPPPHSQISRPRRVVSADRVWPTREVRTMHCASTMQIGDRRVGARATGHLRMALVAGGLPWGSRWIIASTTLAVDLRLES